MMRAVWVAVLLAMGTVNAAEVSTTSISTGTAITAITIVDKQPDGPLHPRSIRMPYVTLPDTAASANINDRLFIGQLNGLAPAKPIPTVDSKGLQLDGIASQDFEQVRLDERLLTLRFDAEGCGAYCEDYSVFYSFDLKNGRKLNNEDMFTPAGMRAIAEKMRKEKLRLYKNQIAELKQELKTEQKKSVPNREIVEDLQDRLTVNLECAERTSQEASEIRDGAAFYYTWNFLPQHASLHAGRCSNHANRALDDVGDITLPLAYAALRPHMTAYGRTMLLREGDAKASNVYGQILRGNLGKQAIIMMLEKQDDDSISGVYFYSKYRKPIELYGRAQGKQIALEERNPEGKTMAQLHLQIDGNRLQGEWQQDNRLLIDLHAP